MTPSTSPSTSLIFPSTWKKRAPCPVQRLARFAGNLSAKRWLTRAPFPDLGCQPCQWPSVRALKEVDIPGMGSNKDVHLDLDLVLEHVLDLLLVLVFLEEREVHPIPTI